MCTRRQASGGQRARAWKQTGPQFGSQALASVAALFREIIVVAPNAVVNPTKMVASLKLEHKREKLKLSFPAPGYEWYEDYGEWCRIGLKVFRELSQDTQAKLRVLAKALHSSNVFVPLH